MGGKRRNTGKTGDKSLYKKAAEARKQNEEAASRASRSKDDDGDDHMYDQVDKYHNKLDKDFLKFDDDKDSEDEEEEVEAVMDLGVGGGDDSSSDDDDSDSDDDDSDSEPKGGQRREAMSSSSSSDDDDEDDIEDVRDWGKKKSTYYHGDTADLELGQDVEDAYLEGEGVKELQKARLEEMDEEDFMPSDDDDDDDEKDPSSSSKKTAPARDDDDDREGTTTMKTVSSIRDVSKLSSKDRRKLLEKQHPGLLQITSHFAEVVQRLKDCTNVAAKALFEGGDEETADAVGATKMGQTYLLTKALIESSTALNLAMFLLLKSEESSPSAVQFHPVMKRLQEFNVLGQKLKSKVQDKVEGLDEQMESLMKAAELMQSMGGPEEEEEDDDGDDKESYDDDKNEDSGIAKSNELEAHSSAVASSSSSSSSDDEESSVDEEAASRSAIQNARFGLRPNEMAQDSTAPKRKRRRRGVPSDLGDDDADIVDGRKGASRYLSSAINSIEQRTASKKKKTNNRGASSEELVDQKDANDELRRGLEMMEAELGKLSDEDDGGDGEALADDIDSDDDDGSGGFYSSVAKKSKRKKAIKKSLYQVAPKYPRLEGEVEGERAISRAIMKNRGLVPHKNKLNRNPRVKKREQYRRALIRRKGAVREVRTDEGHRYGGEETGIKRGISRSRKLGTN